jgi:hypothetical protein
MDFMIVVFVVSLVISLAVAVSRWAWLRAAGHPNPTKDAKDSLEIVGIGFAAGIVCLILGSWALAVGGDSVALILSATGLGAALIGTLSYFHTALANMLGALLRRNK